MSEEMLTYSDNVIVRQGKDRGEFLAVRLGSGEPEDPPACLYRYVVPGRVDIYSFDWVRGRTGVGSRVRYFTDTRTTLPAAMVMLARDLDKKAVVEMLVQACRNPTTFRSALVLVQDLLAVIAPKSAALQACSICMREVQEERRKRVAERLAQRKRERERAGTGGSS